MNILLHICCGPCALIPTARLREQGFHVAGLFYNPNIHGVAEYLRRREAMAAAAARLDLDVVWLDAKYDPKRFFQAVTHRENERCGLCYQLRLERIFAFAAERGFSAVSTTLLFKHLPEPRGHRCRGLGAPGRDRDQLPRRGFPTRLAGRRGPLQAVGAVPAELLRLPVQRVGAAQEEA